MFSFFKNTSPVGIEHLREQATSNKVQWVSLAINKKSIAGSLITKELDLFLASDAFSLKMAETAEGILTKFWKNQASVSNSYLKKDSDELLGFNQLIDQLIETEISYFQAKLNLPPQHKSFSPAEISQEEKALEWIKVSFKILEKAVIESLTNTDLLFQTLLFFGVNPKSSLHEIRLITFNLDILFELRADGTLRVKIYNDKKEEFGSNKKADLEGDFSFRKREMFDELTRLLSLLGTGIKW